MPLIPRNELSFHPHSFADPDGRLFSWDGGLYRAISPEKTPFLRQLFRDGVIQKLIDRGLLVGTEITDLEVDGYGMVLRHHRIPFVSYPHEWCEEMFKDAALAHLELRRELLEYGLALRDTHPWNLLFEGTKPLYVDVTSIRPATATSGFVDYDKFRKYYLHPLALMCHGQGRIARSLLSDDEGIRPSDFSALMHNRASAVIAPAMDQIWSALRNASIRMEPDSAKANRAYLDRLTREIRDIRLPGIEHLQSSTPASVDPGVKQTISELDPNSILAIGATTDWSVQLAEVMARPVVAFDKNSCHMTALYRVAREKKLQLLPLVMDFADPTPARGLAGHVSIAARDRLQCDLVLALGLVTPMVVEKRLRFDQVLEGLSHFSKRWLIVDLPHEALGQPGREYACYTTDNFMNALAQIYRKVCKLPLTPGAHLTVLCER